MLIAIARGQDSVVRVEMRHEPDLFVSGEDSALDDVLALAMHAYIVGEQPTGMSSWTARIQLNKAKLINYKLDPPSFAVNLGH
jgi:hypothetical protein